MSHWSNCYLTAITWHLDVIMYICHVVFYGKYCWYKIYRWVGKKKKISWRTRREGSWYGWLCMWKLNHLVFSSTNNTWQNFNRSSSTAFPSWRWKDSTASRTPLVRWISLQRHPYHCCKFTGLWVMAEICYSHWQGSTCVVRLKWPSFISRNF